MAAPRLLPSISDLARLVSEGMTHQQIADHINLTTGQRVSRSTVSVALSRAGLAKDGMRYKDELPWKVKAEHLTQYPARMLRLLGRQRAGMELSTDEEARLDAWLESLEERDLVVAYAPEVDGFIYVEADEVGDGGNGVPIRKRLIGPEEFPVDGERTGDV